MVHGNKEIVRAAKTQAKKEKKQVSGQFVSRTHCRNSEKHSLSGIPVSLVALGRCTFTSKSRQLTLYVVWTKAKKDARAKAQVNLQAENRPNFPAITFFVALSPSVRNFWEKVIKF